MELPQQVETFSDSSEEEDRETVDELYDEDADEEDQKWVNKHWRQGQALPTQQGNASPSTDAVLNCPCCFTTLCMDCQRHVIYKTQYRAMFILNCTVKTNVNVGDKQEEYVRKQAEAAYTPATEAMLPAAQQQEEGSSQSGKQQQQQQQKKKKGVSWKDTPDGEAPVHAVECETCGTVVGVQEDEVTHFFNVIAS